jgi:hypothetical protein
MEVAPRGWRRSIIRHRPPSRTIHNGAPSDGINTARDVAIARSALAGHAEPPGHAYAVVRYRCAVPSNASDLPYRWLSAAVSARGQFVVATSGQIVIAAHTRRRPDTAGKRTRRASSKRRLAGVLVAEIELRWHRRQQFRRVWALFNALNNVRRRGAVSTDWADEPAEGPAPRRGAVRTDESIISLFFCQGEGRGFEPVVRSRRSPWSDGTF